MQYYIPSGNILLSSNIILKSIATPRALYFNIVKEAEIWYAMCFKQDS